MKRETLHHEEPAPTTAHADGLRGFFWPRHKYASDDEAAEIAETIGKEYLRLSVTDHGRRE